jgi:hypothetical protein
LTHGKAEEKMRRLVSLMLALVMVSPALAGEAPYIAIVGNDKDAIAFYISPKYKQFMHDQELFSVPVCDGAFPTAYSVDYHPEYEPGCEQFRSRTPVNQPEVCDINGYTEGVNYFSDYGQANSVTRKGYSGWYEWYVRLPERPSGEINLVLQCGVLHPNAFAFLGYDAVGLCAGETGQKLGTGLCTRAEIKKGQNPVDKRALPMITAMAYPGPYSVDSNGAPLWAPFKLTAYKNPGTNNPFVGRTLVNGEAAQVLDGSDRARILLKSCMDETLVVKLPATGQIVPENGGVEHELVAGDLIYVRMDIPETNTMDIYCHEQSLKVMGIGGSPF